MAIFLVFAMGSNLEGSRFGKQLGGTKKGNPPMSCPKYLKKGSCREANASV